MKKLLILSVFTICIYSTAHAEDWGITEEMMDDFKSSLLMIEKDLYNKSSCIESIQTSRMKDKKGFTLEVFFKDSNCVKKHHLAEIQNQTLSMLINLPELNEVIDMFHRGLFVDYVFRWHGGKIGEFTVNRETLYWKQFSRLVASEQSSKTLSIRVGGIKISFDPKELNVTKTVTPGYPMPHNYCDIEFKQERYYFEGKKIILNISVIALSNYWPVSEQLQCINEADFRLQKERVEKYRLETPVEVNSDYLKPVYKIIGNSENEEYDYDYALSSLIGKNFAIYLVFTANKDTETENLINNVITSVKFEREKAQ